MTWSTLLGIDDRAVVFDVVRASVWADGRLTADELSAARGTAIALGVLGHPRVIGALARPASASIDVSCLSLVGRHVAFAAAVRAAWIDGEPCASERAHLEALAERLALDDEQTRAIVREVARSAGEVQRAGGTAMTAEDWAIEIDGLLAWTALFAVECSATFRSRPLPVPRRSGERSRPHNP